MIETSEVAPKGTLQAYTKAKAENERLRHIVRTAADFRDQIHPDVDWDRVPPWTMSVVRELDRLLAAFDEEDDRR